MPIPVACPGCSARLNAPDQAAGKAVRCPKCQTPVPVPKPPADEGFEVVDDPPPVKKSGPVPAKPAAAAGSGERPAARRSGRDEEDEAPEERPSKRRPPEDEESDRPSKRRPAAVDEGDDEDDRPARSKSRRPADDEGDDDERPRRKEKPAGNSRKQRGLIAGAVGGVLFIGLIFATMQMMSSVSDSIADQNQKGWADFQKQMNNQQAVNPLPNFNVPPPNANNNPPPDKPAPPKVPAGWEKFNDPLNELALYFPGPPTKNQEGSDKVTKATGGPGDIWMKEANGKVYMLSRMTASPLEVRRKKPEALLFDALKGFSAGIPGARPGNYDLPTFDGGRVSRYVTYDIPTEGKRAVVRGLAMGNRVVMVIVIGPATISAKDADLQPFLDNARFEK